MKAHFWVFETDKSIDEVLHVFESAVKHRPLKLKVVPTDMFTPDFDDPVAIATGETPDAQLGAMMSMKVGSSPPMASLMVTCQTDQENGRLTVYLRCTGNMRGRSTFGNSMAKHLVASFRVMDAQIQVVESTGRI